VETITRFSITLPRRDNDGVSVEDAHAWTRRELSLSCGGVTVSLADGTWIDNGRTYADASRVYSVDVAESDGDAFYADVIEPTARHACALARQECIYVTAQDSRGVRRAFVS
jgi:regulation of enolase protein 1 (concanavalin A-like superfamily)